MSRSPLDDNADEVYLEAFDQLSLRIRQGSSFSGGERNTAFRNRSGQRFDDVSYAFGLDALEDGRGIAVLDLDGDGDQDLCTSARTAPRLRLLRNDLESGKRSLRFLLQGDPESNCPRDAIGARVEVEVGARRLSRTLFAGDGFASQSSKWLHFGLGEAGEIGPVTVRWPGGGGEKFTGISAAGSFVLEQGKGRARAVPVREGVATLAAEAPPLPAAPTSERIRLSQPLLLPGQLGFENFEGKTIALADLAAGGALLINLWGSWSEPCLEELAALGSSKALQAAGGVRVIALNVDALDGAQRPAAELLRKKLDGLGFAGEAGYASEDLVGTLNALLREAVYRHRSLPLPSSFLIDEGGWLSVIYKGPVGTAQVVADRSKLGRGPDAALKEALPFEGIWAGELFATDAAAVAGAYAEGGYRDDAIAHLQKFLGDHPVAPGATLLGRRAAQRAELHALLGELLSQSADPRAALGQFKAAVRFQPDSRPLQLRLARALGDAGDLGAAIRMAAALRESGPDDPGALALSGDLAMKAGERAPAAKYFERVLAMEGTHAAALNNLAWIRATAPEDELRNGAEAVRLVKLLLANGEAARDPNLLSTAAAAYAEAGRFADAITIVERALQIVGAGADQRLRTELQTSLAAYRAGRPFRDL